MKYMKNTKLMFYILLFLNLNIFTPVSVIYYNELGLSFQQISLINLIVPITCAISEIPTGVFGDYIGRKKTHIVSMLLMLLSSIVLFFSIESWHLFTVAILEGIGWSFFSGNTNAIIVEEANDKKIDVGGQLAYMYIGFTVAPILVGIINATVFTYDSQLNISYIIFAVIVFKSLAVLLSFFIKFQDKVINKTVHSLVTKTYKEIITSKKALSIVLYEASGRLDFYLPVVIQTLLMLLGVKMSTFGIIYLVIQGIGAISQTYSNVILKKLSRKRVLILSTLIISLGLLLLLVNNIYCIIIASTLIMAVGPVRYLALEVIKNEMVTDENRSTYTSFISFFVLIINSILLYSFSFVFEYSHIYSLIILATISLIIGLSTVRIIIGEDKNENIK